MDEQLLHARFDKIDGELKLMNETLLRNTISLEEHMRRTELVESDVKPLKEWKAGHDYLVRAVVFWTKVASGAGAIAALAALVAKLLGH